MDWNNSLIEGLQWSEIIINKECKERVAKELALRVKENEVIGAGSGSTVYLTLFAIAERIKKIMEEKGISKSELIENSKL